MRKLYMTFMLSAGLALVCGASHGASLKVSPARFILHNVVPGKQYDVHRDTGLRLTIYNDSDTARTWSLSAHRPSERGRWEKGYGEIPDPKWCWFDKDEVTVPPNGKAYAHFFLEIPDDEKYLNQHWVCTLSVGSKPDRAGLSVAVDVRALIETRSNEAVEVPPAGDFALAPSTIQFENVVPGEEREGQFRLYKKLNSDIRPLTVSSLWEKEDTLLASYLTSTYTIIPDTNWLSYDKEIDAPSDGPAMVTVRAHVPQGKEHYGKKWEDILMLYMGDEPVGFVRVQIETADSEPIPAPSPAE